MILQNLLILMMNGYPLGQGYVTAEFFQVNLSLILIHTSLLQVVVSTVLYKISNQICDAYFSLAYDYTCQDMLVIFGCVWKIIQIIFVCIPYKATI